MRVLVVSDSHGNKEAIRRCLAAQPTARIVIFLGDGLREAEDLAAEEPQRTFYCVPGNCDLGASALPVREEKLGGVRVLFTHGHLHKVKYGMELLAEDAKRRQAELVFFGHTHQPMARYDDGVYYVNPGSVGKEGRYAVVDIVPNGVMPNLLHL